MEFGIGWRIMALLVISQFIGFATALREPESNVAMSNPEVSLPSVPSTSSGNSNDSDADGVHKNISKPRMEDGLVSKTGTDKSNKTETSFVTKVEHLVCSTVGLLCPDKHSKGSDDKAPTQGSEAEKGRNEVGKNSTSVEENKGKDKSSRSTNSSSSSSNSHSEDKNSNP